MPELTPEYKLPSYEELPNDTLLAYISLSMAKLAINANPELKLQAKEAKEAMDVVEVVRRRIGAIATE